MAQQTFGLIADEYLAQQEAKGAAPATQSKTMWLLKDLAAPVCNRPIAEITPAELLTLLQRIERADGVKPPVDCAGRSAASRPAEHSSCVAQAKQAD